MDDKLKFSEKSWTNYNFVEEIDNKLDQVGEVTTKINYQTESLTADLEKKKKKSVISFIIIDYGSWIGSFAVAFRNLCHRLFPFQCK